MASFQAASFVSEVLVDAASLVGVEVVMLGMAAIAYVLFGGQVVRSRPPACGTKISTCGRKASACAVRPLRSGRSGVPQCSVPVANKTRTPAPHGCSGSVGCLDVGDLQRHAVAIRGYAREQKLESAERVFKQLRASGPVLSPLINNCFLDACVHCGDIDRAASHFAEMKERKSVDVVGYNTMIKAYLALGQEHRAQMLVKEMPSQGLQPNSVTFHTLLHARVLAKDRRGMWDVIDGMQDVGISANSVTCSILLKSLTEHAKFADVYRVIALVEKMEESVDEVLFSSLIEACIRMKQLQLLSDFMQRYRQKADVVTLGSSTYGSMIKAYGQAGDVARVRELWYEMEKKGVIPTSITLGCLTEALVINGHPDEAWAVVRKQLEFEERREGVNTVIYSTVIKGFASYRRMNEVFDVYEDMRARSIPRNVITYNTLLEACAKSCAMKRASQLLEDMGECGIEPDIITYSTLVKGYCSEGDVNHAFRIFEEMKRKGKFAPDEMMYNSILDGCAKQHRLDDALRILEEMTSAGVHPSNYTLSIFVKLLGHAKRLNQAFSMVEDLSSQNGFRPNIQVYTCLVQACIQNRRLDKALEVHETMLADGACRIDEKFYAVLVRGCLQLRQPLKAVQVVRVAYHLGGNSPAARRCARPVGVELCTLGEFAAKLKAGIAEEQQALAKLTEELQKAHGLNLSELSTSDGRRNDRRHHGGSGGRRPACSWGRA